MYPFEGMYVEGPDNTFIIAEYLSMAQYDGIWPSTTEYGRIWPRMIEYSRV